MLDFKRNEGKNMEKLSLYSEEYNYIIMYSYIYNI